MLFTDNSWCKSCYWSKHNPQVNHHLL